MECSERRGEDGASGKGGVVVWGVAGVGNERGWVRVVYWGFVKGG